MDTNQKNNKRHSNHYSNYQPSYRDHSANRDSFDKSFVGASRSDSVSPNSQRKATQLTFECRVCLNTYQTKRELIAHLHAAKHLRSLPRANIVEDDQQFTSRKRVFSGFTCKVCSDHFETHSELRRHLSDSGHHWTPKHSRRMSSQDRSSYTHEKYPGRHRHQSLTDARSDKSFDWQNRDLVDAEGERGRSSLSLRSYGSSDLILDTSTPMLDSDIREFAVGIYNSRLEETDQVEAEAPAGSSQFETDNDPSIITSPNDSVMLPSKGFIEVSSTSESKKGVAVIPTESSIPTDDPRQNFACKITNEKKAQSKNQNTKWVPVFCDRPKPRSVEKRIPWKLIPIDFSPINNADNEHPDGSTLIQTVPNPTEEVQEVSIDQLAAQLKENTGATFIPHLRLPGNVSHSTASFEDNLSTRSNRDTVSSHVSSTSLSEDHAALQSPTPCLDQSNLIGKKKSLIKISNSSIRKSTTVEPGDVFDGEPRHPDSTSWSSSAKCDETTSIDKNAYVEIANSLPSAKPISIPPPVVDHQVEADILKALETLSPMVTSVLQPPISMLSCSSQVLISDTENMEPSQCPLPVQDNVIDLGLPDNALYTIAASEMVGEEPYLFQPTSEKSREEIEASLYDSENSSNCSPEPAGEPIMIDDVVESCPCCLSGLDVGRLKIDLTTGNASVHCLACSVHIVMKNVFRKMR